MQRNGLKLVVKNKLDHSVRMELSFEEFKEKFEKELNTAITSYTEHCERKLCYLPSFLKKNDYEGEFFLSLHFNFNNYSHSNWYIDKLI